MEATLVQFGEPGAKEFECPNCGADWLGVLYEPPWFKLTGGHNGDSGAGGNTPQDPVVFGLQSCPGCPAVIEVEG